MVGRKSPVRAPKTGQTRKKFHVRRDLLSQSMCLLLNKKISFFGLFRHPQKRIAKNFKSGYGDSDAFEAFWSNNKTWGKYHGR
jgi:hypothetical protein